MIKLLLKKGEFLKILRYIYFKKLFLPIKNQFVFRKKNLLFFFPVKFSVSLYTTDPLSLKRICVQGVLEGYKLQ